MSVATPIFHSGPVVLPIGFNPYLAVNSSPFMLNQRNLREKNISSQETTQTTLSSSSDYLYLLAGVVIIGVLIYIKPSKTIDTTAYRTVA